jgi:hypothetical protein
LAVTGSPAKVAGVESGDSFVNRGFIAGLAGTSLRLQLGAPNAVVSCR